METLIDTGLLGILKYYNKEKGFGFIEVPNWEKEYTKCYFRLKDSEKLFGYKGIVDALNKWDGKSLLCFYAEDPNKTEKGFSTYLKWVEKPKKYFLFKPDISKMLRLEKGKVIVYSHSTSVFANSTYQKDVEFVKTGIGEKILFARERCTGYNPIVGSLDTGVAKLLSMEEVDSFYKKFAISTNGNFIEIQAECYKML